MPVNIALFASCLEAKKDIRGAGTTAQKPSTENHLSAAIHCIIAD